MSNVRLIISILITFALIFEFGISIAHAELQCTLGKNFSKRIDSEGGTLANSPILDQDGLGVCYAAAASTILKSIMPSHPDISFLQIAIDFAKNDQSKGKSIANSVTSDLKFNIEGGADFCSILKILKKSKLCKTSAMDFENAYSNVPAGTNYYDKLDLTAKYFDSLQLKQTQPLAFNKAYIEYLKKVQGEIKTKCNEGYPAELKTDLMNYYYEQKKNVVKIDEEIKNKESLKSLLSDDISLAKAEILELSKTVDLNKETLLEIQKNQVMLQKKLEQKSKGNLRKFIYSKKIKSLSGSLSEKAEEEKESQSNVDLKSKDLKSLKDELKIKIQNQQQLQIEIDHAKEEKKSSEQELSQIGSETLDSPGGDNAPYEISNHFQLNPVLNKELNTSFRKELEISERIKRNKLNNTASESESYSPCTNFNSALSKTLNDHNISLPNYMKTLNSDNKMITCMLANTEADLNQCNKNNRMNLLFGDNAKLNFEKNYWHGCADDKTFYAANNLAYDILNAYSDSIMSGQADEATIEAFSIMNNGTFGAVGAAFGSHCINENKIPIDPSISCETTGIYEEHNEKRFQDGNIITHRFTTDENKVRVMSTLKNKGISMLNEGRAVPVDLFVDVLTDDHGQNTGKSAHAVAVTGYRCEQGKLQYLIQNSWGKDCSQFRSSKELKCENGKLWVTESLMNRSIYEVSIVGKSK